MCFLQCLLALLIFGGVTIIVNAGKKSDELAKGSQALTAALMGFVGAGGIGQQIELSMRMFEYHEAVSLIAIIFALSALVEWLGDILRRSLV